MESAATSNEAILEKVMGEMEAYWMSDDEKGGEAIFNKFAEKYADKFTGDYATPEDNDNNLEYTTIHKEYQQIFEKEMERIITECGCTAEDFYKALAAQQDGEESMSSFYIEMITSLADYEQFV